MDPQALAEMEKLARQKAIIRVLESSNGQNMDHAPLTAGPNKGQTAGGAYGIVPNSLRDFAKQSQNRNIGVDPDLLVEMDKPHNQVTRDLNTNRVLDDKAAEMALRLINAKTGGDEEKSAFAWRTGHNQNDAALAQGAQEHPYVEAYRREREKYLTRQKPLNRQIASDSNINDPALLSRIKAMFGMQ